MGVGGVSINDRRITDPHPHSSISTSFLHPTHRTREPMRKIKRTLSFGSRSKGACEKPVSSPAPAAPAQPQQSLGRRITRSLSFGSSRKGKEVGSVEPPPAVPRMTGAEFAAQAPPVANASKPLQRRTNSCSALLLRWRRRRSSSGGAGCRRSNSSTGSRRRSSQLHSTASTASNPLRFHAQPTLVPLSESMHTPPRLVFFSRRGPTGWKCTSGE
jgi:hypothetical protein